MLTNMSTDAHLANLPRLQMLFCCLMIACELLVLVPRPAFAILRLRGHAAAHKQREDVPFKVARDGVHHVAHYVLGQVEQRNMVERRKLLDAGGLVRRLGLWTFVPLLADCVPHEGGMRPERRGRTGLDTAKADRVKTKSVVGREVPPEVAPLLAVDFRRWLGLVRTPVAYLVVGARHLGLGRVISTPAQ
jgi:hypothetical protein